MMRPRSLRIFVICAVCRCSRSSPHGDGLRRPSASSANSPARGHEIHLAARRVDLAAELPGNVHLHRAGHSRRRPRLARVHAAPARLYRRLAAEGGFDLVHQLNPVDVGISLALADAKPPLVLGPYVPDWAPTGAGADAEVSAAALRAKRVVRALQQRRAAAVLLSTAAAGRRSSAGTRAFVHELPSGIDDRAWLPARRQGGRTSCSWPTSRCARASACCSTRSSGSRRELPEARLMIAGGGPEPGSVRAPRARHRPRSPGSSCSATSSVPW